MTPKDKADKLYWKFVKIIDPHWGILIRKYVKQKAIQCAMICVDEILHDAKQSYKVTEEPDIHPHAQGLIVGTIRYWQEVKQELEKMKK